jgi:hypothetical protein
MAKRGGRPADITGVHADPSMGWVTKEQLANSKPFDEYQLIAPGVKGKESNLYKALALPSGVDSNGRMPVGGPYMTAEQTDYIAAWIDEKMPD